MKKKMFAFLLAVVMVVPSVVNAADGDVELSISKNQVCEDDICTNDMVLTLKVVDGDGFTISSSDELYFDVTRASGVYYNDSGLANSDTFTVSRTDDRITLSLISPLDLTLEVGDEVVLGTVSFTYASDIEDCTVTFNGSMGSVEVPEVDTTITSTENSQTGINIPLVAIGVAGILAIGIYTVVGKKNKIYNV